MKKLTLFLIKADNGKEALMRLPVNAHGGITPKGFSLVRARFYDGIMKVNHGLKYALNLEAYGSADSLISALQDYKKNII